MNNAQEIPTLEKIDIIVQRYQAIPKDYRDIEELMYWQRKLACALMDYAGEIGDLYKASKGTEYVRKSAYEKERLALISEGKSASGADAEARAKVAGKELFDEACADADYKAAYLQFQAAGSVLDAMKQHIANLKEERRLEMTGQGSQTT